jgi:trimeric autotransporter adhesin
MNARRNAWRVVAAVALGLVLTVVTTPAASAAVTVSRAEMNGGQLRLEGSALANRTITVDGAALGTSDGSGRFRIERSFTPPADCTVDVNDGSAMPANARLSGCTVTTPPPPPPPPSSPTLTGLSLNPATVVEGSTSTGTVTLSGAAGTGGVVVSLTSGNASAASVPSTVTVAAGATSATFTVTPGTTTSTSSSVITASAGGVSRTALFTVTSGSPTLSNLSITPLSVTGGSSATGTVTLTAPATGSGVTVSLSSNNAIASVPASVTVAPGAETGSFTVTTTPVTASSSALITATHASATRNFTLAVTPAATGPAVTSVTLSQTNVVGGTPVTGTVRLASAAQAGGQTVVLTSDNTNAATVPPSVTVPAGQITATFPVETKPVTNDQSSLIVAEAGGGRVGAVITVRTQFSANNGSLSLARGGNGEGRVTSSPAGIDCTLTRTGTTGTCGNVFFPAGTNIRLDARPLAGSRFQGWDFEVSCRNAPNVTIQASVAHICRPVFRLR